MAATPAASATPFSPQVEGPQIGPWPSRDPRDLVKRRRETPRTATTSATRALLRGSSPTGGRGTGRLI
jgi:hypothetical protein